MPPKSSSPAKSKAGSSAKSAANSGKKSTILSNSNQSASASAGATSNAGTTGDQGNNVKGLSRDSITVDNDDEGGGNGLKKGSSSQKSSSLSSSSKNSKSKKSDNGTDDPDSKRNSRKSSSGGQRQKSSQSSQSPKKSKKSSNSADGRKSTGESNDDEEGDASGTASSSASSSATSDNEDRDDDEAKRKKKSIAKNAPQQQKMEQKKQNPNDRSTLDSGRQVDMSYELPGPQGQSAHYEVGLPLGVEENLRGHPGPGYYICKLFMVGECNNFSAFADHFQHGDPLDLWPDGGLCRECWQRRRDFKERGICIDVGNDGSPKRSRYNGRLHELLPIKPDFNTQHCSSILFYGDAYCPRMTKGSRFFRDIELPSLSSIDWTTRLVYDPQHQEWGMECDGYMSERQYNMQKKSSDAGLSPPQFRQDTENPDLAIKIHDSQPLACSAQELVRTMFELYCRDNVGKVSPSLLSLVHNLDPDVVVLSAGTLDLTEGLEAKDIMCALKLMGEEAIKVPRKSSSSHPRKIVFYGIPISPSIEVYQSMRERRDMVLNRLKYWCQDHPDYILVRPDPEYLSGESGSSATYPCTTEEYQRGVRRILDALIKPIDKVIEEEWILSDPEARWL